MLGTTAIEETENFIRPLNGAIKMQIFLQLACGFLVKSQATMPCFHRKYLGVIWSHWVLEYPNAIAEEQRSVIVSIDSFLLNGSFFSSLPILEIV